MSAPKVFFWFCFVSSLELSPKPLFYLPLKPQHTAAFPTFTPTFLHTHTPQTVSLPKCGAIHETLVLDQSNSLCLLNVCVNMGAVTAPSLTCPPQRYLGTPLPGPLCGEEGRHPRHLPTLYSTAAFEHFLDFNGDLSEKLLHSISNTATYKKESSLSLLPPSSCLASLPLLALVIILCLGDRF